MNFTMKLSALLTALISLPMLSLLTGCGGEKAKEEYEKPMAEEIAALQKTAEEQAGVKIVDKAVTLKLQVPSPAWTVSISEAWIVGEELWVIAKLAQKQNGMAAQVITDVEASVTIPGIPDLPVTYYVLGKTFGWEPEAANVKFIDSISAIEEGLDRGEKVYPK